MYISVLYVTILETKADFLKLDKIEHNWVPIQTFNMGVQGA